MLVELSVNFWRVCRQTLAQPIFEVVVPNLLLLEPFLPEIERAFIGNKLTQQPFSVEFHAFHVFFVVNKAVEVAVELFIYVHVEIDERQLSQFLLVDFEVLNALLQSQFGKLVGLWIRHELHRRYWVAEQAVLI